MLVLCLTLLQLLSLVPSVASQQLQDVKTKWPDTWFYTDAQCSKGDWSKKFGFKEKTNDKCQVIHNRRAILVYPDEQPLESYTKGCVFLYRSDDCSENKNHDNYGGVDAFPVDFTDSAKCYQFANDETYYNSFMATTHRCDYYLNDYNWFDPLDITPYTIS